MNPCVACGSRDCPRRVSGFLLCWRCRRLPEVRQVLGARMQVRTPKGVVLSEYSRAAVVSMLREVAGW